MQIPPAIRTVTVLSVGDPVKARDILDANDPVMLMPQINRATPGGLLFLLALSKGEASIVITFTALYPVVTIMLSFALFREAISLKQGIGIMLALVSMVLLAG